MQRHSIQRHHLASGSGIVDGRAFGDSRKSVTDGQVSTIVAYIIINYQNSFGGILITVVVQYRLQTLL